MNDIDDRWYRTVKGPNGRPHKVPTARHGAGKRWVARWRDGSVQRKKSFENKEQAKLWLAGVTVDQARGTYLDPRAGRERFRVYAERWRTAQVHRPSTVAHVESHLRNHVYPRFGDRALSSVRPSEIQA